MNLGSVAKQVLSTVGPTLLTALGGPFGPLAAGLLHIALGTSGDEKAVDTALANATPDTLLKVKQAEADLQAKMAELGIQREQLVYQDIANARAREIAVKDSTPRELAFLIIGGFLLASIAEVIAMMVWPEQTAKVPAAAWGTIGLVMGYLANEAKQCSGYYFGSSSASQAKDATLAEIAKQP